jgi:hypothetical protein
MMMMTMMIIIIIIIIKLQETAILGTAHNTSESTNVKV